MGSALARGLAGTGQASRLLLIDPAPDKSIFRNLTKSGARFAKDASALAGLKPEAIVLAVKPQIMPAIAPAYAGAAKNAVVISIAAGTPVEKLNHWLGTPRALIRAMPNLPASIGKGITAAYATPSSGASARKCAARILKATGDLIWLEDENLLNAVTAVSGSGPAYAFLFVEVLARAAQRQGLSEETARRLARKTLEGAAALLAGSELEPAQLRQSVTSPGGTTEAALKVLMTTERLAKLMDEAVDAATKRAFELAGSR